MAPALAASCSFCRTASRAKGPEHSSARIERFLQLAAEDNIQVCNLTTPAQFFHVLRRQVKRPWRKPLVVFTPKSLAPAPAGASSTLDELASGAFQRVIAGRRRARPGEGAARSLLCSGKVFYDLADERADARSATTWPSSGSSSTTRSSDALGEALAPYPRGTRRSSGSRRSRATWAPGTSSTRATPELFEGRLPLSLVSRAESASPATGSKAAHELEQKMLLDEAFA